jgi:hypothetical protein
MNVKADGEKFDGNMNVICMKSDISEWRKYLVNKGDSLSRTVREILRREVKLKKLEEKE